MAAPTAPAVDGDMCEVLRWPRRASPGSLLCPPCNYSAAPGHLSRRTFGVGAPLGRFVLAARTTATGRAAGIVADPTAGTGPSRKCPWRAGDPSADRGA